MRNGNFIVCFIFSILITLGFGILNSKNVNAYVIGGTTTSSYLDDVISDCESKGYSYIVYKTYTKVGDNKESDCVYVAYTDDDVFYTSEKEFIGGFKLAYEGWHYRLNKIVTSQGQGYTSSLPKVSYDASYYTSSPTICYQVDILDVHISKYADGSDKWQSDIDVNDVNTYPVGHIEFLNPSNGSEIALNYSKSKGYYVRNCKIVGKIPFNSEVEISETDYIKMLKSSLMLSFGKIDNNGKVVEVAENKVNNENGFLVNNFNLKTYGNVLNWRTNGYVTFECTFDEYLTRVGDTVFDFKIKVPNEFKKVLMFFDYDYSIYDVSTSFSIKEYVDLNGDGIDDNTGETIPNDYFNVSDSSSDWDDMDLMQKIEYLFTSVPNMLSRIFDSIINSIKYAFQCLGVVVSSGSELGGIFNNLFGIFPSPIPELVTLCIFVIPFIALFSWIKK